MEKTSRFFEARLCKIKGMQKFMHLTTISSKKLLKITYLISKRIAFASEVHTITENLIKPCMLKAVKKFTERK